MWYVYVLQSLESDYRYIGSTNDPKRRLAQHNAGEVPSTKPYKPYKVQVYVGVETEVQVRFFDLHG